MRRAAIAAVIIAALGLDGEAAETSLPFDHDHHQKQLASANQPEIDCAGCHAVDKRARPKRIGHGACFGKCHGQTPAKRTPRDRARKSPYKIVSARRAVCTACHSPEALDRVEKGTSERLATAASRRPDRLVSAPVPHAAHAKVSGDCLACHTSNGGTAVKAPHQRCVACHRIASKPAMADCAECHTGRAGPELRPYSTARTFDHAKHAPRVQKGADKCRACHAPDSITPGKAECSGCHDGVAAFSLVETSCRRCHTPPARPVPRPLSKPVRFSHETHAGLDRKLSCSACHQLDAAGQPRRPGNQHAPCADSGCHATDFSKSEPRVCDACHIGTEPWLELYSSVTPPPDTEFGSLYSHKAHSGGDKPRHRRACTDCHNKSTSKRELRLPRGHATCASNGCHERGKSGVALESCESCHVGNLVDEREKRRADDKWSVRDKFSHDQHATEPGDADTPVPCVSCHERVDDSDSIFDIPAPVKTRCTRCHDGKSAFKLTGHGCSKCHDT